ncbi:hypothetical protein MAUB1S_10380 [Mycolicibacterium aubagnense]
MIDGGSPSDAGQLIDGINMKKAAHIKMNWASRSTAAGR